jgi:BON domain
MSVLAPAAVANRSTSLSPPTPKMELGERVEQDLREGPYSALRGVHCEFHEGIAILRGRLPTYYLKQVAQTLAAQSAGVRAIVNRIEVVPQPGRHAGPATADGARGAEPPRQLTDPIP